MSDACKHATLGCNYPEGECAGACTGAQSEALRLADVLDLLAMDMKTPRQAAAELRRLHAENEDFRSTCEHLIRENAEQIGEIVALKEQRDELLEALKGVIEVADFHELYGRRTDAARAAIAKATGETK